MKQPLFYPSYESVFVKYYKEFSNPFIQRVRSIAETFVEQGGNIINASAAVDIQPDKAARFIKVNIACTGLFKKLLCNKIDDTFVFNLQNNSSAFVGFMGDF